jgi:hypothetical protein
MKSTFWDLILLVFDPKSYTGGFREITEFEGSSELMRGRWCHPIFQSVHIYKMECEVIT